MRTPTQEERQWLFRYLEDHLLGATSGVRLFKEAADTWEGTPHGETLMHLYEEISGERSELLASLEAQGHAPNTAKMLLAQAGAAVARINPLNIRGGENGPGAQLELEALQSLVRGKEALWETLLALLDDGWSFPKYDRERLSHLAERARGQQQEIAAIMCSTAAERFRA